MGLIDRLKFIVDNDFQRLSYTEAIDVPEKIPTRTRKKFNYLVENWGVDLQSEHERFLVESIFESRLSCITIRPRSKAFYMRQNEDGKTVAAMDVLFPGYW